MRVLAITHGALRTARPTFKRADDIGDAPESGALRLFNGGSINRSGGNLAQVAAGAN